MATRDPYVAVAGSPATAAGANEWAKGWLADVTSSSTQTADDDPDVAVTDLTATFTIEAGRKVLITGWVHALSSVDQDNIRVRVSRNGTAIESLYYELDTVKTSCPIFAIDTPSAGSVTYAVSVLRSAGTGTITLSGGNTHRMLIEDIGSAS